MIGAVKDVEILSSFRAYSKEYGKIESRKSHGLLFKISGMTEYRFAADIITLEAGNVLYIPEGAAYEYTSSPKSLYVSINFSAEVEKPFPAVCPTENFYKIGFIRESFSESLRLGSLPEKYACTSVFYDLLSYFARREHLEDLERNRGSIIEPAIEYLKAHLFDPRLRIGSLARLSCISDTYFRRLFASRFQVSPGEYIISKRMSHAKAIMESGDFDSIAEVAALVGYRDPLYFSKAFKKFYGVSPSDIYR